MVIAACLVVAVVNIMLAGINLYLYDKIGLDSNLYAAILCATTGLFCVRSIFAAAKR